MMKNTTSATTAIATRPLVKDEYAAAAALVEVVPCEETKLNLSLTVTGNVDHVFSANDMDVIFTNTAPDSSPKRAIFFRRCGFFVSTMAIVAVVGKGGVIFSRSRSASASELLRLRPNANANAADGTPMSMSSMNAGVDIRMERDEIEGEGGADEFTKIDGGISPATATGPRALQTLTYEFTKVGDGSCIDGNGDHFNNVMIPNIANADDCAAECSSCPGQNQLSRQLRGFTFASPISVCACHVDTGYIDINVCPNVASGSSVESGTGPICSVSVFGGDECWKVVSADDPLCPTPSPAPTVGGKAPKKERATKAPKANAIGGTTTLITSQMKSGGAFDASIFTALTVTVTAALAFGMILVLDHF